MEAGQGGIQNRLEILMIFSDPRDVGVGVARGGGGGPARPRHRAEGGEAALLLAPANTCQDSTSTVSEGAR